MKKILFSALAVCLLGVSAIAFAAEPPKTTTNAQVAGEFGGHCTMGLALGKEVKTDCKIAWTDEATHKNYCFSSEAMKTDFAKDSKGNLAKAETHYKSLTASSHTGETASKM